jgi:hypothetical protein
MVISQVAEKHPAKVTTFISLATFLRRKDAVPPKQKVIADHHSILFILRNAYDDPRMEVTAAGHLHLAWVRRCQASQGYCFSHTVTLFMACPCAFVPVVVTVIVFPSSETTRFEVATTFSPFLSVRSMVRASMRLRDTVSAF